MFKKSDINVQQNTNSSITINYTGYSGSKLWENPLFLLFSLLGVSICFSLLLFSFILFSLFAMLCSNHLYFSMNFCILFEYMCSYLVAGYLLFNYVHVSKPWKSFWFRQFYSSKHIFQGRTHRMGPSMYLEWEGY